ncbi:hypothetical protein GB937_009988 [Aspergillus fischeri]|nr:hypothetical protein GB937_009988 [Aspergillus fischeri]
MTRTDGHLNIPAVNGILFDKSSLSRNSQSIEVKHRKKLHQTEDLLQAMHGTRDWTSEKETPRIRCIHLGVPPLSRRAPMTGLVSDLDLKKV